MTWPELRGTDKSQEIQSHHNRKYPKFSDIFPSFSDFRFWLICNHFTSVFLILIFSSNNFTAQRPPIKSWIVNTSKLFCKLSTFPQLISVNKPRANNFEVSFVQQFLKKLFADHLLYSTERLKPPTNVSIQTIWSWKVAEVWGFDLL